MSSKQSRKLKEAEKKMIASSQEWKCNLCYHILSACYQVDHIIPFSISNNDSLENLQALCPNCHSSKTQREYNRIYKFKKLSALKESCLCWYCLESLDDEDDNIHMCDKILKDINFSQTLSNKKEKKINELDKYYFTEDINNEKKISKENITDYRLRTSLSNLSLGNTNKKKILTTNDEDCLNVKITCKNIFVNEVQKDSNDLSILSIAKAINEALQELHINKQFSCIEMQILLGEELEEDTPDELFDFLYENLPQELNKKFFIFDHLKFLFIA